MSGAARAVEDLATALSFIFANAQTLEVDTRGDSLWGSSAGARMAAYVGSHGVASFGGSILPKPAAVIVAYTGHSEVSPGDPPNDGFPVFIERTMNVGPITTVASYISFVFYNDTVLPWLDLSPPI